ncbi:MAG TPA: hypothetical protein VGP82_05200 [Ktedonobacterales bacterium]|nr:hypothetical protein [Ktedonobacterales bacterium]
MSFTSGATSTPRENGSPSDSRTIHKSTGIHPCHPRRPPLQTLHAKRRKFYAEQAAARLELYRAQVLQRKVFRLQGKRGRAVFSWLLDRVAGHGYEPQRSLYTYLGVLFGFAALYSLVGNGLLSFGLPVSQFHDLPWCKALILSVSSLHGRGFFQLVQSLGDPVAILAALEAVFGLFIEVSFIATFTQRFFGK